MEKMKLLSPAGDMESLKMAVLNGADEVYLGVKDFNARNIEGFSLETLKQAVDFAHIYGVKVHLAVNILFTNDEMQNALNLVVDAYNLGVDAFIVQDLGLAYLLHQNYPKIELHASTQMGLHNLEGVEQALKFGFKRVVLARETPLDEIARIKQNTDVEIEYFAQGALCVSFSGNCYMSSYVLNASGNRGKCKQLCRLPYDLRFNNRAVATGYLLSAKDFNMIGRLDDLAKAGVTAIKIEGRARRPYYVGVATRTYGQALDGILADDNELPLAFNRGYTEGYFNGNFGIISKLQNHIGVEIGTVERVKKGKRFNEIFLSSNRELTPKSSFKFFRNGQEVSVVTAYDLSKSGNLYRITTTNSVQKGDVVNLINDFELEQQMIATTKKINKDIKIVAKINQPITALFEINGTQFKVKGDMLSEAKNSPLTIEELQNNFKKNEYFNFDIDANIENVFIPKQKLNEFRRQCVDKIIEQLTAIMTEPLQKIVLKQPQPARQLTDFQFVENTNQDIYAQIVVFDPEIYDETQILEYKQKIESTGRIFVLNLPNFALKQDVEMLKQFVEKHKIPVLANNLYSLGFNTKIYLGGGINIYNDYSASVFNLPYIPAENIQQHTMPYMTLRHCPMKEHLHANCSACPYKDGYEYVLNTGKRFKLKRKKLSTCTFYLAD